LPFLGPARDPVPEIGRHGTRKNAKGAVCTFAALLDLRRPDPAAASGGHGVHRNRRRPRRRARKALNAAGFEGGGGRITTQPFPVYNKGVKHDDPHGADPQAA
jgi:hypothetical protein